METINSVRETLKELWIILNRKQKIFGLVVFAASLVGAVLEVVGVGIIVPLVQAFMEPNELLKNTWIHKLVINFNINGTTDLIIMITVGVIMIFLVKNAYFVFLVWLRKEYSCKISRELSSRMMRNYMHRGYEFFLNKNTSELSRNINADVSGVDTILYQMLRVLIDGLTILLIVVFIMLTDWIMAISVMILAIVCLLLIYGYFRVKMRQAGIQYNKYNGLTGKYLLEALHGIKEILVMNKQEYFIRHFEEANIQKQKGAVKQAVGAESPAYVIEAICVAGLLGSVCVRMVLAQGNAVDMVPALSAFAVGAFRILPSLGRISSALNTAIYYIPSLNHVYENLGNTLTSLEEGTEEERGDNKVTFGRELILQNISWQYQNTEKMVVKGLNLTIHKGSSVAFVGLSGAGKTTLADIILGLLIPQEGSIYLDNQDITIRSKSARHIMGYVPQSVYLTDDTIKNNVAFGIEENEIEEEEVWRALEEAQLKGFVEKLEKGIDTVVGDRGIRFSGGQRQRIAIARALYRNPDIIIFDEATASLDNETENAVMESIRMLQGQKTLIIIAHRLTTIQDCDIIYEIKDGVAIVRDYEDLI